MRLKNSFLRVIILSFCLFFFTSHVFLDAAKTFRIKRIKTNYKRRTISRSFSSGLGSLSEGAGKKRWAEIEILYESKPKWADEITITYHVLFNKGSKKIVLSDSFKYINIKKGVSHYDAAYVHPFVMERFGKIDSIAVEIWHEGALKDRKVSSKRGGDEWWTKYTTLNGNLRVVYFTPFVLDNPGKFEMLKVD